LTQRIAHFSDTHVLSLKGVQLRELLNKRITGAVNLALNRAKHYRVEVFEQLLDAVVAVQPDHSICTGDLVNLALTPEFVRVHELLSERFEPHQLTLVPGNHDYYTKEASLAGRFEEYFDEYLPHDLDDLLTSSSSIAAQTHGEDDQRRCYPVTRVLDEVCIIGLSTAIPTASFMATGEAGVPQRGRLMEVLNAPDHAEKFKLLMLHHPLFPEPKRRLDITRRLYDASELIELLDQNIDASPKSLVDLIVHGHNHEFKRQALPQTQTPVIQVASASRTGKQRAEFHIYVVEDGELHSIERHIHSPEEGRFIACDEQGAPLA
jgi:3',5'-cyclic AMP phosphodiesterase CpdA